MHQKLRGGGSRNVARVLAAFAAALVAVSLVPGGASAAPAPKSVVKHAPIKFHIKPASKAKTQGQIGTQSASSGAASGDWTGDGKHDILAREVAGGTLKVYPHSGTFNGSSTFNPAVNINYGWGTFRWIGVGKVNADSLADVLAIDGGGTMRIYPHSGNFSGLTTLSPSVVVGYGWNINDLTFVHDVNGDGFGDVVARRAGTDQLYMYPNTGGLNGLSTFGAPQLIVTGVGEDVELNMADVTRDGVPDLLFLTRDGVLGVFSPVEENSWGLMFGWETMNAVSLADVNFDGNTDILGRTHDGRLQVYPHSGTWAPTARYDAFNTFQAPVFLGWGWNTNNVIS
jgi:hypothetical protein